MSLLPVALLVAALALFLFSARPTKFWLRIAALGIATALLVFAAIENIGGTSSTGLLSTLLRHPDVAAAAFAQNWRTVGDVIAPAVDVLLILAALLGIGCFVALTPGDRIERFIRPVNIGLLGAILGAALVLVISAVGFGPVSKRQVFIAYVDAADVVDGDTIRMGDVGLRLSGIDAPEDHQICLDGSNRPFDCGREAADVLRKLAIPGPVFCRAPRSSTDAGAQQLRESFGRPLVACGSDQQGYGQLPDIGRELVLWGHAYPYQSPDGVMDSPYGAELAEAKAAKRGFHSGRFLEPTRWRNDPKARCDFIRDAGDIAESDPAERDRLGKQLKRLREACGDPA
jgi:endonuclease YncB( thermonuclease family)